MLLSGTTGTIDGYVYADPNQTGTPSGNLGLAGRQVYVDLAGNGAYTVGDPTATTAGDGSYSIPGLAAGTYTVEEVVPVGYGQTAPSAAAVSVAVTAGGTTEQDFGELQLGTSSSFSFGNLGSTTTNFTALNSALQTDGKVVVVGYVGTEAAGDEQSVVARYFPDGTPDRLFGNNGYVVQSVGDSESIATDVLVEADGNIVVVGAHDIDYSFDGETKGYAERLFPDGTLDPSFSVMDYDASDSDSVPLGVVQLPDGTILLSGSSYTDNGSGLEEDTGSSLILDLEDSDGALNSSFGDFSGYSNIVIPDGDGDLYGAKAAVDPNSGDIYVPGSVNYNGMNVSRFELSGYTPTGHYQEYGTLPFADGPAYASRAVVEPNGNVLVVGYAEGANGNNDFALVEAVPDVAGGGFTLDTGFGDGGTVTTDFGGDDEATDVQLLSDGSILVSGTSAADGETVDIVEHYAPDGTPLGGTASDGETDLGVVPGNPVFADAAPAYAGTATADADDAPPAALVDGSVGFPPPYTPVVVGSESAKDVTVETAAPTVTYASSTPASVTADGSTAPEILAVQYTDPIGIDLRTLSSGNLMVALPSGATEAATYLGVVKTGNTQDLTAEYSVAAPAGGWVPADDGTYTVSLVAGQVSNTAVAAAAVPSLGTFTVTIGAAATPTPTPTPTGTQAASTTALTSTVATIDSGNLVVFTATVTGTAGGAAPTGTVTFSDGATALGTAAVAGGVATFSTAALPAGANAVTAAYGGDASYAASTSAAAATVTVAAPAAGAAALTPSLSAVALPSALVAGATKKLSVPIVIGDTGTGAVKGPVTVTLYASTDTTLDANDPVIATLHKTLAAKAGKSTKATLTLPGLPASLAAGTYHLLAQVTDPSGFAQTAATATTVTVAAPFVSPAIAFAAATTAVVNGTKRGSAQLSITNHGNVAIDGPVTVTLYETATGAVDTKSATLGTVSRKLNVPAGKTVKVSVPVTAAKSLAAGTYQLAAVVTTTAAEGAPATSTTVFDTVTFPVS